MLVDVPILIYTKLKRDIKFGYHIVRVIHYTIICFKLRNIKSYPGYQSVGLLIGRLWVRVRYAVFLIITGVAVRDSAIATYNRTR